MCSSGWGPSGPFGPSMPRGLGYKPGPSFGDPATIYPPGVYKVSDFHWWGLGRGCCSSSPSCGVEIEHWEGKVVKEGILKGREVKKMFGKPLTGT